MTLDTRSVATLATLACLVLGGCTPPVSHSLGPKADLSREQLLFYASRAAAASIEGYDDARTDPTVTDIVTIKGRPDLLLVVVQDQWCQGHAVVVDREGHDIFGFYPGQYCEVTGFSSEPSAEGVILRASYSTARGNHAGQEEAIIRPDDSIEWLTQDPR